MNLTDGGLGTRGHKWTESSKERIRGRVCLEATKEKLRQHNLGKTYSQSTKDKHKANQLKRDKTIYVSVAEKLSKPVTCITTGISYNSCNEAEKAIGVSTGSVSRVCIGTRKSIKGLVFQFINHS